MSRITLAFGSLIVGAMLGFFWGSHTSTVAQPAFAETSQGEAQHTILDLKAIPVVPPISERITKSSLDGARQQLDGIEFADSTFNNVTFEYSGGSYQFTNDKFSLPMRVELFGCAANTLGLVALVQALNSGAKPQAPSPNAPIVKMAMARHTATVNFRSPFGSTSTP